MSLMIFLDGRFVPKEEAKVSVYDHGFLYGDGVFEGIRAYRGRVFRLDEHVRRLYDSARAITLRIPLAPEEMRERILETCRLNGVADGYIRVVVSRGPGDLGIDPRNCKGKATVVIIADRLTMYPPEMYEKGMAVITTSVRRNSPAALDPAIKSLNYLNNILAKIEVNRLAAASPAVPVGEGLMLTLEGYVAEATGDNVFIVRDGLLITPPSHVGILEGITRNAVLGLAARRGIPAETRVFTLTNVYSADEMFLTGTGAEVIPVIQVDGRTIGEGVPGPITRTLITAFSDLVRSEGAEIQPAVAG